MIARGTPLELKQRFAGDVLDVTVDGEVLDRVVELVADVGSERPGVDRGTRRVSLPVDGGAGSLVEVVRRLDEAGIKVVDITLRRPSLDDVFLALTGHATAPGVDAIEASDHLSADHLSADHLSVENHPEASR